MARTKKHKHSDLDIIKAVRKANREAEIALYGKVISTRPSRIHKSKKAYDRNKQKNQDLNEKFSH